MNGKQHQALMKAGEHFRIGDTILTVANVEWTHCGCVTKRSYAEKLELLLKEFVDLVSAEVLPIADEVVEQKAVTLLNKYGKLCPDVKLDPYYCSDNLEGNGPTPEERAADHKKLMELPRRDRFNLMFGHFTKNTPEEE